MIFAILFFAAFVIGLLAFVLSNKWWLGGLLCASGLIAFALVNFSESSLQGVTLYFGIPIVFLGSLFGAYIVQLRRAPEESEDIDGENPETAEDSNR